MNEDNPWLGTGRILAGGKAPLSERKGSLLSDSGLGAKASSECFLHLSGFGMAVLDVLAPGAPTTPDAVSWIPIPGTSFDLWTRPVPAVQG